MSSSSVADPAPSPPVEPGDGTTRSRRAPVVLVAILMAVLVGAVTTAVVLTSRSSTPRAASTPPQVSVAGVAGVGSAAPPFTLERIGGGEPVSLGTLRNKTVVINFWASWCVPCREEFPALREFSRANPDVVVLGVTYQDNTADAREFATREKATWPLLLDPKSAVAQAYGVRAIPQTFVVNGDGVITYRTFGTITASGLAAVTR